MQSVTPWLWFNGQAQEAAKFYASVIADSRVDRVVRSPADHSSGKTGSVLFVEFTLMGRPYVGLNAGPNHPFTEAVSLQIMCDDQAEVDYLWEKLSSDGGSKGVCGWLKDRWGFSWQITPRQMIPLLSSPDPAANARAMKAMMTMTKIDIAAIRRAVDQD